MLLFYSSERHWLVNNLFETQYGMASNYTHFPQKWLLAQPERVFNKSQFCADLVKEWKCGGKKELLSNSKPGAGERSVFLIDTNNKKQCNKKRRLKMRVLLLWK